jgi:hypothetical protein
MENNLDLLSVYTGIHDLKRLLDKAKIENYLSLGYNPYFFRASRYQITVPLSETDYISIIQGPCSMGCPELTNYVEVCLIKYPADLLEPEAMSVKDAFKFIKKQLKRGCKHGRIRQEESSNMDNG